MQAFWKLGLVVGCALVCWGCGSVLIDEADAAMEAGEYETAVGEYREARANGEGDADELERKIGQASSKAAGEHRAVAEGHERAGRWDEAMAAWEQVKSMAGNDRELRAHADAAPARAAAALAAVAAEKRAAGDLDGALSALAGARRWDAQNATHAQTQALIYVQRAKAHMAQRNITGALADYQAAVDADPENVEAADGLQVQQATEARVNALVEQGKAAETQDDFDGAVAAYDEALVLWPDHPDATARKQAIQSTKAYLDAFRKGVAELNAKRYDSAIAAFNEAAKIRETDLLTEKRNEAYRAKWMVEATKAETAGDFPKAVEAYEQAQRYAAEGSKEWDLLAGRIRTAHYTRWMKLGKDHEANRRWIKAAEIYAKVKANWAAADDAELVDRILAVEKHLVRVQCDLCMGTGQEEKYKLTDDGQQIPVGKVECSRCGGDGEEVRVKAGSGH